LPPFFVSKPGKSERILIKKLSILGFVGMVYDFVTRELRQPEVEVAKQNDLIVRFDAHATIA
jgi:hypothetical protein